MRQEPIITHFHLFFLVFLCVTVSFTSVQKLCVETSNEAIEAHLEFSKCPSNIRARNDNSFFVVKSALFTIGNGKDTSCYDISADFLIKRALPDDSFDSLIFTAAPIYNIFFPLLSVARRRLSQPSPIFVWMMNNPSPWQNLQTNILSTVVILT